MLKERLIPVSFIEGEQVSLKGRNLKTHHPTTKLAPRRYGPFLIDKKLSPVTYRLTLPPSMKIHPVTTFPPFRLPHAYYRLSSLNPVRIPCFVSHVTFPSTITLLLIITCRRDSSSSLSRTLTHYAYPLISDALYDTSTRCGRSFPGLSCI